MDSAELGKRIKEARLARKMTQSELVGTFITRNMLSRIESGNACPSVKTLEYLAQRLELPAGSLISDAAQGVSSPNTSDILLRAKQELTQKNYTAAAKTAQQLLDSDFSDEGNAILARCFLEMARHEAEYGEAQAAARLAKSAMDFSENGIYRSKEITAEAMLIFHEMCSLSSDGKN